MSFINLKQAIQRRFNEMKQQPLFQANIEKQFLWDLYLDSFPAGTNPKYRERSEYDCCACRSFVKHAGGMVTIVDGQLSTLWDVEVEEPEFKAVVQVLGDYVRSCDLQNIFLHTERQIGTDKDYEKNGDKITTWEHLYVALPNNIVCKGTERGPRESEARAQHDVVLRALQEVTPAAIETVLDLIAQNSLYRGAEKQKLVQTFGSMKTEFDKLPADNRVRDLFAWAQVQSPNAWACKVRSDVIGTLLVDLSEGKDLEIAVKSFEDKVSGTNYQRPTALVTPRMRDEAKAKLTDMGFMPALDRRYAKLEDININDVLFADRNVRQRLAGDVFDSLPVKANAVTGKLDRIEEMPIDKFISDVLPTAQGLELLFEGHLTRNLVSLIAPQDLTAKTMFKWPNAFSWSYTGDVADSIKERVKAAGGNVTGEVCCRLAWSNTDDLDFHMKEPNGYEIFYGNRERWSPCGGTLDVDMNAFSPYTRTPVENIVYRLQRSMAPGTYELAVHQFCARDSQDPGFEVEIDVLGTVHKFEYPTPMRTHQKVIVARLEVDDKHQVKVAPVLNSTQAQKQVWGIKTQDFHKVSAIMLSPNHWGESKVGNKHFFFMLQNCQNDGSARGFYNEFLSSELEPHRRTMELVGSRMRTDESQDQLSGLGFSSTQRNHVVCRVHGSFVRMIKIVF
jgi:hypothetical protein